jgi:hypothetical protein
LDAPSAYEDQVFLCEASAAVERAARTAGCRLAAGCAGWVSFRGVLQDQLVTVGSPLLAAELDVVNAPGVGLVREELVLRAESPYFRLRWAISELPPLKTTAGDLELRVAVASGQENVRSSLRLNGGGASVELNARSGMLQTSWDMREQSGQAELDFGAGNQIDGCFYARVTSEPAR